MDLISTLGYALLWGYALFGLIYFTNKILKQSHPVEDISNITEIDGQYYPVSKQNLEMIFSDFNLYNI